MRFLIVGIAIMGFSTIGLAYEDVYDVYEEEDVVTETAEEESVAEAESEVESGEEDVTVYEARIEPIAGSKEEEEYPGVDAPFHH